MFGLIKKTTVVCVGSASKDIFFPTDEGIVIDTPDDLTAQKKIAFELGGKQKVDDLYEAIGGVAANVAEGLSKLGISSSLYSNIGGDETGRWILHGLKEAGVATDRISIEQTSRSDLAAIVVLKKTGERTIFHNRDANEKLQIVPEKLHRVEWVFVSSLNGPWEKNLREILSVVEESGAKLAINPGQHNLRDNPELVLSAARHSDVFVLNKDEALELTMKSTGNSDPAQLNDESFLLRSLHGAGAKIIAITDGARGAWGYDGTTIWHCPIGKVERVVDTTGAGDAFTAAFLAAHILGKGMPEMLAWGIAESGSVVRSYGAVTGQLSRETIDRVVQTLQSKQW